MNKYDKITNVIKQYSENVDNWDNEMVQEFVEALKDTAEYKLLDTWFMVPRKEFHAMRFLAFHTDFDYVCCDKRGVFFFQEKPYLTEDNLWTADDGNFHPVFNNFLEPNWGSSWLDEGMCIQIDPIIFMVTFSTEDYVWIAKKEA